MCGDGEHGEGGDGGVTGEGVTDGGTRVGRRSVLKLLGSGVATAGVGGSLVGTGVAQSVGISGSGSRTALSGGTIGPGFVDPSWVESRDLTVHRVQSATRSAVEEAFQASGPRVVVFETSGTIDLDASTLAITNDHCWVAGQTAPSPGITFVRGGLSVEASNCVLQHVRVRAGTAGQGSGWAPDAIHTADGTTNNVIDHCTATWGVDECCSVGYDTDRTTLSNNLIAEGLNDATHAEGAHSCGTLVGDGADRVALLGNVWANNVERNPLMKYDTRNVVANNVVAHFDQLLMLDTTVASIVGNTYLNPGTPGQATIRRAGEAYLADNHTDNDGSLTEGITSLSARPLWPDSLDALSGSDTLGYCLSNAGARPTDRTHQDRRIFDQVRNDGGAYVDDQSAVGGYPQLPENTRSLSVPDSSLADWLAEHASTVESAPGAPSVESAPSGSATATVTGAGDDVWGTADACHFCHEPVTGDFDAVARVDSLQNTDPYAKAGLMVRAGLEADAANAFVRKTPGHQTSVQWRAAAGLPSRSTTTAEGPGANGVEGGTTAATWQRLVRQGEDVLAFVAGDDRSWTRFAHLRGVELPDTVQLGLAVTSHASGTTCTAEFSGVAGLAPHTSSDVGGVEAAGSASFQRGNAGPPEPVAGTYPTDPDGDGVFEDLNGNGEFDSDDVVTLFQHIDDPAIQNHASYYDVNGNGNADFDDAVTLFQQL